MSTSWPGRTSSAARIDRAAQPGTDRDARRRAWSEREPGPPPRLALLGARRPTVHAGPRPRRSTGCWSTTSPLSGRCTRSASSQRTVRCGRRRAGRWAWGTGSPPSVNGRRARDRGGAGARPGPARARATGGRGVVGRGRGARLAGIERAGAGFLAGARWPNGRRLGFRHMQVPTLRQSRRVRASPLRRWSRSVRDLWSDPPACGGRR